MIWKVAPQTEKAIISPEKLKSQLLKNRRLKTKSEIDQFFNPDLKSYQKDFILPGISKAKARILQAIKKGELIIIYGDYDVDGICASAVCYHGLVSLGAKVLPYIPHREKEGYGLSTLGLNTVKEKGGSLVITVDNGIVAYKPAKYAKKLGLDLIITDHHVKGDDKLDCYALVHSTKLSGTGVAWCLIKSLVGEKIAYDLLDFVATATICDLMPLLGVNRSLVSEGLKRLNRTTRVGWKALFSECKIDDSKINAFQVGYIIGPRLNAVGRLEHAIDSLRLLCTKDLVKARQFARLICQLNDQKKVLISQAIIEAKSLISQKRLTEKKILVLYSESWIPGIVGLVAGRISEEFHLPTIAISKGSLQSKGSARTVDGLNIVETIRKCQDLLIDVGGHPQAAGFTIATDKIALFERRLEEVLQPKILDGVSYVEVEVVVNGKNITKNWVGELEKFEPFGVGNPRPILASYDMTISDLKTVGDGQHLKFKADDTEAIAFQKGELVGDLKSGQGADLAYYLDINSYRGEDKLQLKVLDLIYNKLIGN